MVVKTKDIWMKVLPDGGMLSPEETPLPEGATKME
jgi:hypothetical protein